MKKSLNKPDSSIAAKKSQDDLVKSSHLHRREALKRIALLAAGGLTGQFLVSSCAKEESPNPYSSYSSYSSYNDYSSYNSYNDYSSYNSYNSYSEYGSYNSYNDYTSYSSYSVYYTAYNDYSDYYSNYYIVSW